MPAEGGGHAGLQFVDGRRSFFRRDVAIHRFTSVSAGI
jgi:hypothetical protein